LIVSNVKIYFQHTLNIENCTDVNSQIECQLRGFFQGIPHFLAKTKPPIWPEIRRTVTVKSKFQMTGCRPTEQVLALTWYVQQLCFKLFLLTCSDTKLLVHEWCSLWVEFAAKAWGRGPMASAEARAYNGSLGGAFPSGVQEQSPWWGQGAKPPEAKSLFMYQMSKIRRKINHLFPVFWDKIVPAFNDCEIASYRPKPMKTLQCLMTIFFMARIAALRHISLILFSNN